MSKEDNVKVIPRKPPMPALPRLNWPALSPAELLVEVPDMDPVATEGCFCSFDGLGVQWGYRDNDIERFFPSTQPSWSQGAVFTARVTQPLTVLELGTAVAGLRMIAKKYDSPINTWLSRPGCCMPLSVMHWVIRQPTRLFIDKPRGYAVWAFSQGADGEAKALRVIRRDDDRFGVHAFSLDYASRCILTGMEMLIPNKMS
jgi:hypothetical protein